MRSQHSGVPTLSTALLIFYQPESFAKSNIEQPLGLQRVEHVGSESDGIHYLLDTGSGPTLAFKDIGQQVGRQICAFYSDLALLLFDSI